MQTVTLNTLIKFYIIVPFSEYKEWSEEDLEYFENFDDLYSIKFSDELSMNLFGKQQMEKCDVIKHYIFETYTYLIIPDYKISITGKLTDKQIRLLKVVEGVSEMIIDIISYQCVKNGIDIKKLTSELNIPLKNLDFTYDDFLKDDLKLHISHNENKIINKVKTFSLNKEKKISLTKLLLELKNQKCFIDPTTEIVDFEKIFSDSISESKRKYVIWIGSLFELKKLIIFLVKYDIIFREEKYTSVIINCFKRKKNDLILDITKEQLTNPKGSNRNLSNIEEIISKL